MHHARIARLTISALTVVWWSISGAEGQMEAFLPADSELTNTPEFQRQLSPGKTPGTFAFSQSVSVKFAQDPAYPVVLTLNDIVFNIIGKGFWVADDKPMMCSADLRPGGYWILQSNVTPRNTNVYLSSACEKILSIHPDSPRRQSRIWY